MKCHIQVFANERPQKSVMKGRQRTLPGGAFEMYHGDKSWIAVHYCWYHPPCSHFSKETIRGRRREGKRLTEIFKYSSGKHRTCHDVWSVDYSFIIVRQQEQQWLKSFPWVILMKCNLLWSILSVCDFTATILFNHIHQTKQLFHWRRIEILSL